MSSFSNNMTLDLLFSPEEKPQMSCNKIHYFSVSISGLHSSSSLLLSATLCPYPIQPHSICPSSLHVESEVPVSLSLRSTIPHAPLHSSFHYQKQNPLTAPHNREIQSVYPPAQWEIWTLPFTKRYAGTERKTEMSGCIFLLGFSAHS